MILAGTDEEGARIVADKARAAVEALAIPHPNSPVASTVTVSVGIASVRPVSGVEPAAVVAAADDGLYRAKRSGRNRVCAGFSPPGTTQGSAERGSLQCGGRSDDIAESGVFGLGVRPRGFSIQSLTAVLQK